MGGSVSFSYWSAEEQRENKTALELQSIAKEFIIANMYYGIPVRSGKISHDPRSPLWIELDPKVMDSARLGKGDIEMALLETVPSAVSVNFQGVVKIMFSTSASDVTYTLHVRDFEEAAKYDDPLAPVSGSMPAFVPTPGPPRLVKAEKDSLKLNWLLPQPPGISQQLELQFAVVTSEKYLITADYVRKLYKLLEDGVDLNYLLAKKDENRDVFRKVTVDTHGLGPCPLEWNSLATRTYHKSGFLNFQMEKLLPGDCYCFRMRYLNHRGWSAYSHPSRIFETLPAPPSVPSAPISGFVASTSVQLFWVPPFRDNGSPITHYRLRGKSAGGDFVELFRGQNTSFLATDLHPEFIYSFEVAAVNSAGVSEWSLATSVTTPKSADKPRPRDPDSFEWLMALQFRDAWRELWDPKTEQVFYFNTITSTRQLEKPAALQTDVEDLAGGGKESAGKMPGRRIENEADKERRQEVEFRKKRYRLLRTIHTSKGKSEKADTKSIELRRCNLLLDGFRKINAASADDIRKRAKFSFIGEPGIDSGGVGKEAFLLLSRQAALYASKVHRGWLYVPDKKTGGLFFCSNEDDAKIPPKVMVSADVSTESASDKPSTDPIRNFNRLPDAIITDMANVKQHQFCRFLGRLLGKAIFDRQLVDIPLSTLLLKHMTGRNFRMDNGVREPVALDTSPGKIANMQTGVSSPPSKSLFANVSGTATTSDAEKDNADDASVILRTNSSLEDVLDLDAALHSSLVWMLENDITGVIMETFTVEVAASGDNQKVALCPSGETRDVTEANKEEYVRLLIQWKTHYAVSSYLDPFLLGFHELVGLSALRDCDIETHELDLMLHGRVMVDIDELRAYCIYQGGGSDTNPEATNIGIPWGEQHEVVVWLWQALRDLPQDDVRVIICFFTGSARVPLDGYDPPLNITQGVDMDEEALPRAHTCFNQLVLPPYKSYSILKEKLLFASKETEGFALS